MGYNVVLELNPEQKQRLKMTATRVNQTVRGFVTALVVTAINMDEAQPRTTKKQNKNNKEDN
ncbi:MAG: hypothetical protein WC822_04980 [Candidatus Paceibacterota bacterium]